VEVEVEVLTPLWISNPSHSTRRTITWDHSRNHLRVARGQYDHTQHLHNAWTMTSYSPHLSTLSLPYWHGNVW